MASDNIVDDYFVERIENVSFANGVFRVTMGTQEESNTRAAVRLIIPANQISSILQGMASAARNIDQKVQAKMSQTVAKPSASGAKKTGPAKKVTPANVPRNVSFFTVSFAFSLFFSKSLNGDYSSDCSVAYRFL